MISGDDIEDMCGMEYWSHSREPMPTNLYTDFVKSMLLTSGRDRMIENTLGLVGEAGEVSEKIKKVIRADGVLDHVAVMRELGDVLFYLTALADYLGYTLQDVVDMNVAKLVERKKAGKVRGDGDDR